jgi:hypothetical protein
MPAVLQLNSAALRLIAYGASYLGKLATSSTTADEVATATASLATTGRCSGPINANATHAAALDYATTCTRLGHT